PFTLINTTVCVGKPTLAKGQARTFGNFVLFDRKICRPINDRPCERKRVTGADHCADRFFALLRIALSCSKWADPPSLRETERRLDGMRIRMFARGISVLFPDLRR